MYWIYLLIFIIAVLIPEIISRDFGPIGEERAEELFIFIIGIISFLLIYFREKQLFSSQKEKAKYQREASRIFRDLKDSYSYIGEINRKLEILKNIALGLPEKSSLTFDREQEIYDSIMEAVKMLSKTSNFSIRFVNSVSNEIERELKGKTSFKVNINKNLIGNIKNNCAVEAENYLLICSPRSIDNINAWIIIARKKSQLMENIEILKALASQALFLFAFSKKTMLKNAPLPLD